jgi:L-ascorbate metabolism protein UlaG (beta-lactamase superfamily)
MKRRHFLPVLAAAPLCAQSYLSSPRRALTAPELRDAPDEWIARSLAWVDDMLRQHPPSVQEHPVRRAALIRLDDILHIESAPQKKLIHDWFAARLEAASLEIASAKVSTGARIWKLYNHGFFIRTASASFVYDLVPGPPRITAFALRPATLERLADQADVLFVSHYHDDHANPEVGELMFARNKPVIGPNDIWRSKPELRRRLISPERSPSLWHKTGNLEFIAFPGHQGSNIVNNCHLVKTPEGFTFLQTGDQSNDEDFAWIDQVALKQKVDVLFPNCWTTDPLRMVRGVQPRLIIPGHENEMAHTVPHREDWTQTYNRFHGIDPAKSTLMPMAWGESFHYNGT